MVNCILQTDFILDFNDYSLTNGKFKLTTNIILIVYFYHNHRLQQLSIYIPLLSQSHTVA